VLLGIDHVVLAVEEPDATAARLESDLGLEAAGGGRHEAMGTFNRLIWLGDTYLELIGVFDLDLARRSWLGAPVLAALSTDAGLATWAIAVDDLDGLLKWLPNDRQPVGPLDGERRRGDGRIVRWRLAHPTGIGPAVPFLIEHDTNGAEWTPEERGARAAEEHPIGGRVRLATIEVRTGAAPAAASRLRSLLSTSVEPDGRGAVRVVIGSQAVRFAPVGPDGGPSTVVNLLSDAPIKRRRATRVGDCEIRVSNADR